MLKWIFRIIVLLIVGTSAAAYALPGPHQSLFPRSNNLVEIAPNIYTDSKDRSEEFTEMLRKSWETVDEFFVERRSNPRIVICTKPECEKRVFNREGPRGIAYGYSLIILAAKGANETILTHELSHTELKRRMKPLDYFAQRFPGWFDEGLAVWLSGDDRFTDPGLAARERMLQVKSFRGWGDAIKDIGWKDAYGASEALVEDMIAASSVDDLRALISRVEAGEDFDMLRDQMLKGS